MLVPLSLAPFQVELLYYVVWYNEYRPHQSLAGCAPNEIYDGMRSARDASRFEKRTKPRNGKNGAIDEQVQVEEVTKLRLVVSELDGRAHLPIVKLERAARRRPNATRASRNSEGSMGEACARAESAPWCLDAVNGTRPDAVSAHSGSSVTRADSQYFRIL